MNCRVLERILCMGEENPEMDRSFHFLSPPSSIGLALDFIFFPHSQGGRSFLYAPQFLWSKNGRETEQEKIKLDCIGVEDNGTPRQLGN